MIIQFFRKKNGWFTSVAVYFKYCFVVFIFILSASNLLGQQASYVIIREGETEKEIIKKAANIVPSKRQLKWQQLELTAFFHFGINTFTDREWGTGKEDPQIFKPDLLDAGQWVRSVKAAGVKQVIITAKHHDGFCLWPSSYTEHSVKNSPWKNGQGDVVKEVSAACKKYGVGFGIYLSPWDRNSSVYGTEAYNDFFVNQLTELLTQYGRVDEVWFDGANGEGPNGKKQVYDFPRWYRLIRKLQPDATIAIMGPDVRWVGTETGQGRETEWSVVPANNLDANEIAANSQKDVLVKPLGNMQGTDLGSRSKILPARGLVWYPAETDVSIRPGWFYHESEDAKVKSPQKLLDIYFKSVGRNGVLLLNIPPDKRGLLHDSDIAALKGWKALRDDLYQKNYAKGAKNLNNKNMNASLLTDGNDTTHIVTNPTDTSLSLELKLPVVSTFNVLELQENILMGQRVERFSLEYWNSHEWVKAAEGTTIGYKRMITFNSVQTDKIRFNILASRLNPYLSELGLYELKK